MKTWYLEHTPPEITSGYEDEILEDYSENNFSDILDTTFSDTVLLYDSNLSEYNTSIKCLIQNNMADTQLKSIERTILAPIGTLKAGQYVFFEDRYWIIDGYPGNNKSYEKATAKLCQYKIKWQVSDGRIKERWVHVISASKYDVGETGNKTIVLSSNTYTLLIGYDEYAMQLDGKRVFIDKKKTMPEKVFKITRSDDVLYDYGDEVHGSILSLIADKTELNLSKDNQELRICDYFSPTTPPNPPSHETAVLSAKITGNVKLKVGFLREFTVNFTNSEGKIVDNQNFTWNVVSDFPVTQIVNGQSIKLRVDDEDYIDYHFLLQVIVGGSVLTEQKITVVDIF